MRSSPLWAVAVLVILAATGCAQPVTCGAAELALWNTEDFSHDTPDLVAACLEAGASPKDRDAEGLTPLHWAASTLDSAGVATLLDAGADPMARGWEGNRDTLTPSNFL